MTDNDFWGLPILVALSSFGLKRRLLIVLTPEKQFDGVFDMGKCKVNKSRCISLEIDCKPRMEME